MRFLSLLWLGLIFLLFSSMSIFLIGLNETIRNQSFDIVEDNLINSTATPTEIYNDYLELKSSYIFTNEPFVTFMNWVMYTMIFYLFYRAWRMGRESPPFALSSIMTSYNIFLILGIYLFSIFIDYIISIFATQLIQILFQEIYSAMYMYDLYITYFIPIMLFAYFFSWCANQIKYFDVLTR